MLKLMNSTIWIDLQSGAQSLLQTGASITR